MIHFKLIFLAKVSPTGRLQPGEEGLPYEKDGVLVVAFRG